ncbi:MAG: hypothetical protein ACRD0Z_03245 [Acidimicrobiales bacterium]
MNEEPVTWLVREVRDLLDASSVGLYEFIWLLRGCQPEITFEDGRRVAELALRQLLRGGGGRLILLTWPSQDSNGDADPEALDESDWYDPTADRPYVALARN